MLNNIRYTVKSEIVLVICYLLLITFAGKLLFYNIQCVQGNNMSDSVNKKQKGVTNFR